MASTSTSTTTSHNRRMASAERDRPETLTAAAGPRDTRITLTSGRVIIVDHGADFAALVRHP